MSVTLALVFAYARGTLCMSIYHFETFSNVISHFLIKVTVAVARLNRNATSPLPLGHCPVNCVSNWADEESTGDDVEKNIINTPAAATSLAELSRVELSQLA
ncbi:hypothetical protein T07_859 [Trichinella nelsoni]|uniref:Secreted protein n=1 Tax=Trichinella nelsoni TaxID=6336 RepID=A0A0V0RYF4_9BILA|nr:hypothetical protein T07_859 [Trichinella nelsoni]